MPDTCRQVQNACPLAAELPSTLGELARLTDVILLGGDIETLALLGMQFEGALMTTRNSAAVISGRGGYAGLQPASRSFVVNAKRANLRFLTSAPLSLARSTGNPQTDQPGSLLAVDHEGAVHHRVQFFTEYDARVAHSLDAKAMDWPEPCATQAPQSDKVLDLNAIRCARQSWDQRVASDHLNDFLIDRGYSRLKCLRHLGRDKAWPVDPAALSDLVNHLHRTQRDFVRIVCATGLMQAQQGRIDRIGQQGTFLACESLASTFAIDLSSVGSIWVTASRLHWQLEIYDRHETAIAILTAPPLSCGQDWRSMLLSMPRVQ